MKLCSFARNTNLEEDFNSIKNKKIKKICIKKRQEEYIILPEINTLDFPLTTYEMLYDNLVAFIILTKFQSGIEIKIYDLKTATMKNTLNLNGIYKKEMNMSITKFAKPQLFFLSKFQISLWDYEKGECLKSMALTTWGEVLNFTKRKLLVLDFKNIIMINFTRNSNSIDRLFLDKDIPYLSELKINNSQVIDYFSILYEFDNIIKVNKREFASIKVFNNNNYNNFIQVIIVNTELNTIREMTYINRNKLLGAVLTKLDNNRFYSLHSKYQISECILLWDFSKKNIVEILNPNESISINQSFLSQIIKLNRNSIACHLRKTITKSIDKIVILKVDQNNYSYSKINTIELNEPKHKKTDSIIVKNVVKLNSFQLLAHCIIEDLPEDEEAEEVDLEYDYELNNRHYFSVLDYVI